MNYKKIILAVLCCISFNSLHAWKEDRELIKALNTFFDEIKEKNIFQTIPAEDNLNNQFKIFKEKIKADVKSVNGIISNCITLLSVGRLQDTQPITLSSLMHTFILELFDFCVKNRLQFFELNLIVEAIRSLFLEQQSDSRVITNAQAFQEVIHQFFDTLRYALNIVKDEFMRHDNANIFDKKILLLPETHRCNEVLLIWSLRNIHMDYRDGLHCPCHFSSAGYINTDNVILDWKFVDAVEKHGAFQHLNVVVKDAQGKLREAVDNACANRASKIQSMQQNGKRIKVVGGVVPCGVITFMTIGRHQDIPKRNFIKKHYKKLCAAGITAGVACMLLGGVMSRFSNNIVPTFVGHDPSGDVYCFFAF